MAEEVKVQAFGRPSEYHDGIPKLTRDYTEHHATKFEDPVPTVEGLAYLLQTGKKTLYRWEEANEDFRHALEEMRAKQGRLLQNGGLTGKYTPLITKLMLSANHGMREKSDMELSGKEGGPIAVHAVKWE